MKGKYPKKVVLVAGAVMKPLPTPPTQLGVKFCGKMLLVNQTVSLEVGTQLKYYVIVLLLDKATN